MKNQVFEKKCCPSIFKSVLLIFIVGGLGAVFLGYFFIYLFGTLITMATPVMTAVVVRQSLAVLNQ